MNADKLAAAFGRARHSAAVTGRSQTDRETARVPAQETAVSSLRSSTDREVDLTGIKLSRAVRAAAELAIAYTPTRSNEVAVDVRRQLDAISSWLISSLDSGRDTRSAPPVIDRELAAAFRTNILAELMTESQLGSHEVIQLLSRLDEAAEAWRRTPRGKFIARLTGSDCADAVVAIAHDIRSPLCSILLLVDSLRRRDEATANGGRNRELNLIYGAALGLSNTVSNLIDAARGELLVQETPQLFSVNETLLAVSAIVQPMCEERGLRLNLQLPQWDVRLGHAGAIHQALLNLTSNALRYTEAGSVSLGCCDLSDSHVEFWVADTGPGMTDEAARRFRDGFFTLGGTQSFSGAGLGLAIVRTLIEEMGGTLIMNTGPAGTRFSFVLAAAARDPLRQTWC